MCGEALVFDEAGEDEILLAAMMQLGASGGALGGALGGAFAGTRLRRVMLVHDVGNPASCRVADKAGYPFRQLSPANPPHWFSDGHIHVRLGG